MVDIDVARNVAESRRGAGRRTAICQAACELLAKVGYDRMTMDAIANQAKASKATIYRMWPDKPQLVAEALKCQFGDTADVPNTGSLRGDLTALMTIACEAANSEIGEIIAGVLTAAAHDPRLAETLSQTVFADKAKMHVDLVRRAADRGEVHPDTDPALIHEIIHSLISGRMTWNLGPLDDEYVTHVVDDILIPVMTNRKP
ncbi:MAG TPA: TetR/AcrR family transcriptional regulator [Actinospica sp.]|jgi:AcrR family transcriptional regulator|nr:TetR/AcrR family transcriptional regulator [Actinospica sp.]